MAVRLGFEDRGFGRAYVIVEADLPEGLSLRARARGRDGRKLPASLIRAPKRGVEILVAPLLEIDYEVTLDILDGDGTVLDSLTRPILAAGRPEQEPPASQLLASGLDDIRYIDLNPTPDAVWLSPTKVVDFDDGTDVVHADVVGLFPEGSDPGAPRLTLLDLRGEPFEVAPSIVLDREVESVGSGLAVHRLQLSFRIPRELRAFVTWTRWGEREGLFAAEPWLLDKLRGEWWDITQRDSNKGDYHHWFLSQGREDDRTLHLQARTPMEDGPRFSIVVPVFETPLDFLADMVDSVRAQTYPRWELLLVNASPANRPLAAALAEAEREDERIRVLTLEGNRGITMNTRVGIDAASGDYVCFLDHDDFLEPNALFEYASAIRDDPSIALLYCDEDLWLDGEFRSGYFKPDFDLDLLLNQNFVTHFLCVSRAAIERLREAGTLPDEAFDGAQDYALTLLVAASGSPIHHVRRFLYHWRAHAGSTSISHSAKTWTDDAGRRALEAFLSRAGIAATVGPGVEQNLYDVRYEVPEDVRISAVVRRTSRDGRFLDCVDSLIEEAGSRLAELAVVDPFGDGAVGLDLRGREGVAVHVVPVPGDLGVAAQRNRGAAELSGEVLLFLDDRCVARTSGWLGRLLGPLQRPDVAVVGAGLVYEDGLIRHVGICLPEGQPRFVNALVPVHSEDTDYYRRMPLFTRGVSAVSASALAVRVGDFRALGGFDEGFLRGFDDVDLCLRLRDAGRSVVVVPRAELTYRGRAIDGRVLPFSYFGQPASPRSLEECIAIKHDEGLFRKRWSRLWGFGDPLYNPQLAKESCHYQMTRW